MKPRTFTPLILVALITLSAAINAAAQPLNFNEVSLLVRARESDQSIEREINQRKLARALTPQQEAILKSQGASDSLLQTLRNPKIISNHPETAPMDLKPRAPKTPQSQDTGSALASDSVQTLDVSLVS